MDFQLLDEITEIEPIAIGPGIRDLPRLVKTYGEGRWRKLKGTARVQLPDGAVCRAEIHWYEAHGIGRREIKIKHLE